MSHHPKDSEELRADMESRQRSTIFPDTLRGGRSVDALLWKGAPHAPLVQRVGIALSSYLLDATRHNRLWFHQFCEWNGLNLNGLLRQSVEQLAA